MVSNPYQQYQATAVETASPVQLVIMLYDGAIRFCLNAAEALEKGDLALARERIARTQAIVEELIGTLNMEAGGEIAHNLFRLYEYMNYRLIQAHLGNHPEALPEVAELLRELRAAWAELARGVKGSGQVAGR